MKFKFVNYVLNKVNFLSSPLPLVNKPTEKLKEAKLLYIQTYVLRILKNTRDKEKIRLRTFEKGDFC